MTTAVLSDLHAGALRKRSLAVEPDSLAVLRERVAGVDHLVLLGDVLELREPTLAEALAASEPLFRALGEAMDGGRVTLVPGNHDHHLAAPVVEARRLDGAAGALPLDASVPAPDHGPVAHMAAWLGESELRIAYPGVWIRDDVFATHGHYLDLHNTVPSVECLAAAATERVLGGTPPGRLTPDDYEAALTPLYSLTFSLAQAGGRARAVSGGGASLAIWRRAGGSGGPATLGGRLLTGVVIPGAVAALNAAGLGPFRPEISGAALRRAALAAMAESVERLGIGAEHVLFGHTHRSGPWPGDDLAEWTLPGGGRLLNTGSWIHDPVFGSTGPYLPGTCAFVDAEGPPRLERLLPTRT